MQLRSNTIPRLLFPDAAYMDAALINEVFLHIPWEVIPSVLHEIEKTSGKISCLLFLISFPILLTLTFLARLFIFIFIFFALIFELFLLYRKIAYIKSLYSNIFLFIFMIASVYKGIHIKTTKNGLPTY